MTLLRLCTEAKRNYPFFEVAHSNLQVLEMLFKVDCIKTEVFYALSDKPANADVSEMLLLMSLMER